jgi:predicted ATP-grasp superfamily ATP-dependent carboligase
MANHIAPKVLIVASVNWEGISRTPYLFSRAGWVVDVFTSPAFFLAKSSFVSKIHVAGESPSQLVDQLKSFLQLHDEKYDKILLGDDPLIWELASRRDEPWARELLPCAADDETIDFLIFKTNFIQGCSKNDIPIPPSFVCGNADQVRHAVREIGFPLILKRNQGHSGEGVRVVHSERELDGLDMKSAVVVQKLIEGKICSAAALYKEGALLGFYSYFRSRTWGPLGSSTAVEFHVFPQLRDVLERLGRISKFDGLCGIDFMHEESTSRIYILEQNFRPTLTMLLGTKVGVDFIALLRNRDRPAALPMVQDPTVHAVVPLFPSDIVRAISQRDFRILLRWLVDPRWIREACWHDRKLLAHNFSYIVRTIREKIGVMFSRGK